MNARLTITLLTLAATPWTTVRSNEPTPAGDSYMDILGKLQSAKSSKPNEVTVVLPPPAEPPQHKTSIPPKNETSKPESPEPVADQPEPAAGDEAPADASATPQPGLAVRIERLQAGTSEIDPAQVKLMAPFPAKLLARSPEGWRIEADGNAPPFTREVELSPGKRVSLSVRPHLLVAEADGSSVFQVAEPGFDAALGYQQNSTVGAILSSSIRQLENDSLQLSGAIEQLQQLLVSLPQPAAAQTPVPEDQPAPVRKR